MGISGFSLIRVFLYMSLNSVQIQENIAQRKPLYSHILCSVQLSLLLKLGTIFFSNTLVKFYARSATLAATSTTWKVSRYGVFSGSYFTKFGLNTEKYFVSLSIQSKCRKIRTRKNSLFGHISHFDLAVYFLSQPQVTV